MKTRLSKGIFVTVLLVQAILSMPHDQKFAIDVPDHEIVGADSSSTGQLLAIVTKAKELRIYSMIQSTY